LLLLTISGLAQDVRYNFAHNEDFSRFKTYEWVEIKDAAKLDQLREKQLKDTIDAELSKKGLQRVQTNGDILIGYQAAVTQEKEFSAYSTGFAPGWGYGPGWGAGWGYGGFSSTTTTGQTSTINIGMVALDMYDAAKHELIWRGAASRTLDMKAKPEKQQKNMTKAVSKLLKNYPPSVKKK
jgi:hypothetical protein